MCAWKQAFFVGLEFEQNTQNEFQTNSKHTQVAQHAGAWSGEGVKGCAHLHVAKAKKTYRISIKFNGTERDNNNNNQHILNMIQSKTYLAGPDREREQQQRGREREKNVDENSKIFSKNKCRKYLLLVSVVVVSLVVVVVVKQHMVACVRKTLKESFGCESFREASFLTVRASEKTACWRLLASAQTRVLLCLGGSSSVYLVAGLTDHRQQQLWQRDQQLEKVADCAYAALQRPP